MDDGVGFSVSNRFIYAPERRSNGSWRLFVSGSKKREIGDVISDSSIASDRTGKWTAVFWLAASNKLKCGPEWRGYCSLRPYVIGLKKRENWQIWRDFQWFLNNHWGCGEIDFTVEFRASNMPKYPLKGSSNRRERRLGKEILKQKNGYVFGYRGWTTGDTEKRMVPLDSAHQIGVFTLSRKVLTVDEGVCK